MVTGRGVVLTLTAEEEGLGWSADVVVTEGKVKQIIVKFDHFLMKFEEFYVNVPKPATKNKVLNGLANLYPGLQFKGCEFLCVYNGTLST